VFGSNDLSATKYYINTAQTHARAKSPTGTRFSMRLYKTRFDQGNLCSSWSSERSPGNCSSPLPAPIRIRTKAAT